MERQTTYRVRNGKLTPASDRAARAQHEDDVRAIAEFAKAQPALAQRLGIVPTNGHAAANGTPATNGTTKEPGDGPAGPVSDPKAATVNHRSYGAVPESPAPAPADGRNASGQFAAGNRAAAGNPFHRAVAARRRALLDAISPEDVAQMARKLRDQALAGDTAAAKVLLGYVVGKTTAAPDPDRLDLEEVGLLMESPDLKKMLTVIQDGVSPDVATNLATKILQGNPQLIAARMTAP